MINLINERTRFFDVYKIISISVSSIMISISIFVVKRLDHELFLKRSFQRIARISSININNESFKMILNSLNEKKRVNFEKNICSNMLIIKKKNLCLR